MKNTQHDLKSMEKQITESQASKANTKAQSVNQQLSTK